MHYKNSPFSVPLNVKDIPAAGKNIDLTPTPEQCKEIANFIDINAVSELNIVFDIQHWQENGVEVKGTLKATVEQTCVISNDVFESTVSEPFVMHFLPGAEEIYDAMSDEELDEHMMNDDIIIDDLVDSRINLGDILAEQLVLALPPFPRKPGALLNLNYNDAKAFMNENPFAILAKLSKKNKGK
jgi:uncharacterized metal-binding protein YceD (DUF177 family)